MNWRNLVVTMTRPPGTNYKAVSACVGDWLPHVRDIVASWLVAYSRCAVTGQPTLQREHATSVYTEVFIQLHAVSKTVCHNRRNVVVLFANQPVSASGRHAYDLYAVAG